MQATGDRARSQSWVRALLFSDEPDPRTLQLVFALLLALDLGLRIVHAPAMPLTSWPVAAAVLTLVTLVAALAVPWSRLPPAAVGALPVLDLAALGLSRLNPDGSGSALLAIVPALWLGRLYGRRGAVVALLAALCLVAVPWLAYLGTDGINLSRTLMLPVVVGWVAVAVAAGLERTRAERDEVEERRVALALALDTIHHQRRMSEAILDTVDVGLVLLDGDGVYQALNRRHQAFMRLGYPDGHEGRAGQLGEVFAEDGERRLEREEMPTHRASLGEELDDFRLWIGADPLTRRAVSVSARTVRDDEGRFAGAALAYHDVTEYMRALRVKDEFVASVSHEVRTPLTSIMGYVNLLLEREDLPAQAVSQLEVVARNNDRLRRLVADLLHTAQADGGLHHVVRRQTDLVRIAEDCVQAARPTADAHGVLLEHDLPDSLEAFVDPQRMAQVFDNLVSNGIKYTPRGGRVQVTLRVDGSRIEFAVADTGIGIEPADRDRLFSRFFRTREAAQSSIQGVGLGLSITKSIVESHGGRIEVDSEVGRGSVFRVRLPLEQRDPQPVERRRD